MAKAARRVVLLLELAPAERAKAVAAAQAGVAGKLGLPWDARAVVVDGSPAPTEAELSAAALLIGLNREKVEPAMQAAFPAHAAAVEYWDETLPAAEMANRLVARLLGGRVVADEPKPASPPPAPPKKVHTVRVGRETAGRRGKGVTTVFDLPLTIDQMHELATTLKGKCGTGGTVKDARIEIQGDHRDTITGILEGMGYKVKRAGG